MLKQNRSINQRLKRAKSLDAKRETLLIWTRDWHAEQTGLLKRLGKAISDDDFDEMSIALGELKAVSAKKFEALPGVFTTLLNEIEKKQNGGDDGEK